MTSELGVRLLFSGAAVTLAALAAERALRDVGRPGRFAWALALVANAALSARIAAGGGLPLAFDVLPGNGRPVESFAAQGAAPAGAFDGGALWLASSLFVLALLLLAMLVQWRRLRHSLPATVDGVDVVVARTSGPAVVGFTRPRIVVPEWLLDRPEHERALVVRHEAEHVAARDPQLAGAALLLVCLQPWNPFLWYQFARMRLAIELDCDARVLLAGGACQLQQYGRLLVDVAERLARGTPLATALAFPRSFLERRIRMMTTRRRRPLRAALLTLAAGTLIVAACTEDEDPVATVDEPADVLVEAPAGEYRYLPSRVPGPPGSEQPEADIVELREGELLPTMGDGEPVRVPFRATLGDDDRPATVEFVEGTPAEIQDEASGQLRLQQFRRSAADPDAPVAGTLLLQGERRPLRQDASAPAE